MLYGDPKKSCLVNRIVINGNQRFMDGCDIALMDLFSRPVCKANFEQALLYKPLYS